MKKIFSLCLVAAFAVAMAGCSGHDHDHDHEGHSHDEGIQLTEYTTDYELYAETKPFVVGKTVEITAHFSKLADFKPLAEGKVTASLIVGNKGIRTTADSPASAGIYMFELTPETKGTGKLVFDIETKSGKSQIVVPEVVVFDDEHKAAHYAEDKAVSSSNGVSFPKEKSWKVDFATAVCHAEAFGQVIRTVGRIEPSQGDERTIAAHTSGIITFAKAGLVEGQTVGAGAALFYIDASAMADNNLSIRLRQVQSDYNFAKSNYERKKNLAQDKIISEADLLEAKRQYESAEAEYNTLISNFAAGKQTVTAPIGGYLNNIAVKNGDYVEAGQTIASVSQNRDLYIHAEVPARYYSDLSQISGANLRGINSQNVYTLDELGGKLISYAKTVSGDSPRLPVVFQVSNKADFVPGSFVEVYIKTTRDGNSLVVPNSAIVEEMGNHFVFAQLTPEFFEKREVQLGVTDGMRTEILSGIKAGERIVTKGAVMVKLAQATGTLDAHSGHVH